MSDDDRNRLIASHHAASQDYDKSILTLAPAALGLSMAFLTDLRDDPASAWSLKTAWWCLGASIAMIVLSHLWSTYVHERIIDEVVDQGVAYETLPFAIRRGVTFLNWIAASAFLAGVVFLVLFTSANVSLG